jgi:hypothetical protein
MGHDVRVLLSTYGGRAGEPLEAPVIRSGSAVQRSTAASEVSR